jgi:methyl-accepting chemotaxis protein
MMYGMRGYGLSEQDRFYQDGVRELQEVKDWLDQCQNLAERATTLVKLGPAIKASQDSLAQYEQLVEQTRSLTDNLDKDRRTLDAAAAKFLANCSTYLESQDRQFNAELADESNTHEVFSKRKQKMILASDVIDLCNQIRVACFKAQALRQPELIRETDENFTKINALIDELRTLTVLEEDLRQLDGVQEGARQYQTAMHSLLDNTLQLANLGKQRDTTATKVLETVQETANAGIAGAENIADDTSASLSTASTTVIVGLAFALVVGTVVAILLSRSITGPLKQIFQGLRRLSTEELDQTGRKFRTILNGLQTASSQTGMMASEVSETSQQMAEGSSEQAASLEETSSSIEEIASVVKNNAEHAKQASEMSRHNAASTTEARSLTGQALESAKEGNVSVDHLNKAIAEIKGSAEETAKIIKTIDEIAFQTNLLALNAAVEAARAGDAGKGFAVVAEEVRNLAQRSATAARNTADLISQSVRNSEGGVAASEEVREAFTRIAEAIEKVSTNVNEVAASGEEQLQLINDVSAASEEQARGIDQINIGISQIDTVTQRNAGNAEELAAAAEEMQGQTTELDGLVRQLKSLVEAAHTEEVVDVGHQADSPQRRRPVNRKVSKPQPTKKKDEQKMPSFGKHQDKASDEDSDRDERDPESVIPMEDQKELSQF